MLYVTSRQDIWDLLDCADAAVDTSEDISDEEVPLLLTVVSAIATIAASAVAPGIAPATLSWTIVAATGTGAANVLSLTKPADKQRKIATGDKYAIADSVLAIVGEMEEDVVLGEATIRRSIISATLAMDRFSASGQDLIGPRLTDTAGDNPLEYGTDGTASVPDDFVDTFMPPSETE